MQSSEQVRRPALRIEQSRGRVLYTFSIDGKQLTRIATVSRIRRPEDGTLLGYQRAEVRSHIAEIRRYLESESPMIPNPIVVAFDKRVRFEPAPSGQVDDQCVIGTLTIPLTDADSGSDPVGFVVDGQQRLAAIREAGIARFPVWITAFIADDEAEQREQFILVNSTKPLPKAILYELLPMTGAPLPSIMERRRVPAKLLHQLNIDRQSPFFGKIRTATNAKGVVQDNSVLKMLENSLSDGMLYRFRHADAIDEVSMTTVLKAFWSAVAELFADAWDMPPTRSRLVHGAGIVSMGYVMDTIADRNYGREELTQRRFYLDLEPLARLCRWTQGYWDFGPGAQRKWNEIQNTSKDIKLLTNYLILQYKSLVWNRTRMISNPGAPGQ
jgi:DGQHR domain-containing protein